MSQGKILTNEITTLYYGTRPLNSGGSSGSSGSNSNSTLGAIGILHHAALMLKSSSYFSFNYRIDFTGDDGGKIRKNVEKESDYSWKEVFFL